MEPSQEIFDAVRAGDTGRLRTLLGANPGLAGVRNERGHTPVLIAQYRDKADAVALPPRRRAGARHLRRRCGGPDRARGRVAGPGSGVAERRVERRLLAARARGILWACRNRQAAPGSRRRPQWCCRAGRHERASRSPETTEGAGMIHARRLDRLAGDRRLFGFLLHQDVDGVTAGAGHCRGPVGAVRRDDPLAPRHRGEHSRRQRRGGVVVQEAFRFGFSSMSAIGFLSGS